MIIGELGRNSAHVYGVIHCELSRTSAPGDGIMCKGFTSLSLQSVQSLNIKLLLISVSKWGGQAGFVGSPQTEGTRSNWKSVFLSHQGKKLWAMAVPLQGSQALTLFQSYTSSEWNNTYANCTEKSNPWALANLPEGHNLYLKRAGKEKGSCTPLPHKIWAQQSFAATVTVKSMCSWDDQLQYQQQIHLLKEDSEIWISTLAFCAWSRVWRVPDEIWAILALL